MNNTECCTESELKLVIIGDSLREVRPFDIPVGLTVDGRYHSVQESAKFLQGNRADNLFISNVNVGLTELMGSVGLLLHFRDGP